MVYRYADPIADFDYFVNQMGSEIERERQIEYYMQQEKNSALMKLTDYLQHDLTPKRLEQLAKVIAYAWFDNEDDANNLVRDIRLDEKALAAIQGDKEHYIKLESDSHFYEP